MSEINRILCNISAKSKLHLDVTQTLFSAFLLLAGLSWELVYSGPAKEHVCDGLKPGCSYQTRIYCLSEGGQSPVSHSAVACLRPHRFKNSAHLRFDFFFFFLSSVFLVTGVALTKTQNCKLLPQTHSSAPPWSLSSRTTHKQICALAFLGLMAAIATTSCGQTDESCMNNSGCALYFWRGLIGNCHSASLRCWTN